MKAYVSLWSADLLAVGAAVDLIAEEADGLHIDVFDGHNVPDLLFGPDFVAALRAHTQALVDVHLNVDDPDLWAKRFADARADLITVQPRVCPDVRATLNVIASAAVRPAVALEVGARGTRRSLNAFTASRCAALCARTLRESRGG